MAKYRIINSKDGRVVAKHTKYERCYVRLNEHDMDEDLRLYETDDLENAKVWLEATRRNWTDDFVIVDENNNVVEVDDGKVDVLELNTEYSSADYIIETCNTDDGGQAFVVRRRKHG